MTRQYQIISTFIQTLGKSCFELNDLQRLKFLLYQLKILLLRGEDQYNEVALFRLCPLEELEELRILLLEARTPAGALMVQGWLEEGLMRIIDRLEGRTGQLDAAAAGLPAPEAGQATRIVKRVNKDISNPGE